MLQFLKDSYWPPVVALIFKLTVFMHTTFFFFIKISNRCFVNINTEDFWFHDTFLWNTRTWQLFECLRQQSMAVCIRPYKQNLLTTASYWIQYYGISCPIIKEDCLINQINFWSSRSNVNKTETKLMFFPLRL